MAVQLYKPGNSHNIAGIDCDIINCKVTSMGALLKDGWYAHPSEFEGDGVAPESDDDSSGDEAASAKEIRALAKEAGLEGHETKRVKTLIKELEDLTNGD